MEDIMCPTSKRFKLALYAFINLAKFRESLVEVYNNIINEFDELQEEKIRIQSALEKDETILQSYMEQERGNESKIKILAENVRNMQNAIREMSMKEMDLKTNVHNVHSENEAYEKKVEENQQLLETLLKENKNLRSQIVINPEDLKRKINSSRKNIESTTNNLRKMEEDLQSMTINDIKNAELMVKVLSKAVVLAENVEECKQKKKEITKQIKSKQEEIDGVETEVVEMENARKQKQKQIQTLAEKIEKVQAQHYQRLNTAETMVRDAQQEHKTVEACCREYREHAEGNVKRLEELKRKQLLMRQNHEQYILQMSNQLNRMETGVNEYHQKCVRIIQSQ